MNSQQGISIAFEWDVLGLTSPTFSSLMLFHSCLYFQSHSPKTRMLMFALPSSLGFCESQPKWEQKCFASNTKPKMGFFNADQDF
jgi:hypothetical protein